MTTPAELAAGWALFGKRPGSAQDYSVIATSGWPLAAANYEKAIRRYLPGQAPTPDGTPANAFPWVTFTFLRLGGHLYRAAAVSDWSGDVDRTGRPIVETYYCCMQADDGDAWPGFAVTYQACLAERSTWTTAGAPGGVPLTLPVPAESPAEQLEALGRPGLERAAEAAAALLDGRPVVLPLGASPSPLAERLAFLDAVRLLLPTGARHWFTAGTWWDLGRRHGNDVTLCLSDRPGEKSHVLGGNRLGGLSGDARRYRNLLTRLADARGLDALTAQLATGLRVRERDPGPALKLVRELDLVALVTHEIGTGDLDVEDLLHLIDSGLVGQLSPEHRNRAIALALHRASPVELRELSPHLDGTSVPELIDAAGQRLWRDDWDQTGLQPFLDIADAFHAADQLLAEVCRRRPDRPERHKAAALLLARTDPSRTGDDVRTLLASDPEFALRVVLQSEDIQRAGAWLARHRDGQLMTGRTAAQDLDRPLERPEAALRALAFAAGLVPRNGPRDIDALGHCHSPTSIRLFVEILRSRSPELARPVLVDWVLPWLCQGADRTDESEIEWWLERLNWPRAVNPLVEARTDFLLARWGRPRDGLAQTLWDPERGAWEDYAMEFTRLLSGLTPERATEVVDIWAEGLQPGWSKPVERRDAILNLLWSFTHVNNSRTPTGRGTLTQILAELGPAAPWPRSDILGRWRKEVQKYPDLAVDLLEDGLRQLPADTPTAQVVDHCLQVVSTNCDPARTALVLANSQLSVDSAGQLLLALVNQWPGSIEGLLQFIGGYIAQANHRSPGLRPQLIDEAITCAQDATVILHGAVQPSAALEPRDREGFLKRLREMEKRLARVRDTLENDPSPTRALNLSKFWGTGKRGDEAPQTHA